MKFWQRYKEEYVRLIRLGLPVLVTQLCVITVSFADTFMVGGYGLNELAASAFVNSLFLVVIVMLIGFAGGVTPLIGALYSRGDDYGIGHTLRASLILNSLISIGFMVVMGVLYFFVDRMGQPVELLPLIRPYYLIMLCTLLPSAIFNCCQQTANGTTDTSSPMWVILIANVLNISGNYVLIYGKFGFPELGLTGAGISTLFARVMAMAAMTAIVVFRGRYRRYRAGLTSSESCRRRMAKVWKTSYPVGFQSGVECSLWSFGAVVAGWFGTVQLAAYQVVNTIGQLGYMIYMSIGVAISVRVANHIGVDDLRGVRCTASAGLHIIMVMATGASLTFLLLGHDMIGLFNDTETVVASGSALILPLIVYQYMDGFQLAYCNAQRGTSEARPLMWAALISYLAVGVPVMLLFAVGFQWGNVGVYYSFSVALLSAAVLLYRWFGQTLRRAEARLQRKQGVKE